MRTNLVVAGAVAVVIGSTAVAGAPGAQAEAGRQIAGTWAVAVDPDGLPPSFTSTLVYTSTGSVVETTMNRPPSTISTGLGTWERLGDGRFATNHRKHRWDGTTYLGTVVVDEVSEVSADGERYTARATTRFLDREGRRTAPDMTSTVTAERL